MRPLLDAFARRFEVVREHATESDPDAVAAALIDEDPVAAPLAEAFGAFSPATRALVVAHGRWPRWSADAASLAQVPPSRAPLAVVELLEAGWLTPEREFPVAIRGFLRARVPIPADVLTRAADTAEAAFHRVRYAGTGDRAAVEELARRCAWHEAPAVSQWIRVAREEPAFDEAPERARVWAALAESRSRRWRGFYTQSDRWLDRADGLATEPRARFFVQFLRIVRAEQGPETRTAIQALAEGISDEEEWFFVHQAEAVWARSQGQDATPALRRAIQLAQRLGLTFREAHLRILIAHSLAPDGPAMRQELELIDLDPASLQGRERCDLCWIWARAWLADEELEEAARYARLLLAAPSAAEWSVGHAWAVVSLSEARAGDVDAADRAWRQARRRLEGPGHAELLGWLERIRGGGPWHPMPDLNWAVSASAARVSRAGRWFQSGPDKVDLSRSPVSVALLRALVEHPRTPDELIEAAWPGDASSYDSLKGRLHSALRVLRRRGLGDHLTFDAGRYLLEGIDVVD